MRLTLFAVLVLTVGTVAAPAPKLDSITGEFRKYGGRDPILIRHERTPVGKFEETTYWLVFTSPERERDAVKFSEGDKVTAFGTIGHGGQYRYVIVDKVAAAD